MSKIDQLSQLTTVYKTGFFMGNARSMNLYRTSIIVIA